MKQDAPSSRPDRQRGAATIAAAVLCSLLIAGTLVVAQVARAVALAQRTQTAADLAALTAANAILAYSPDPCRWASRTATSNRAVVQSCVVAYPNTGPEAIVTVVADRAVKPVPTPRAHARAGLRRVTQDDP